jgi:hypothetical protein
MWSFHHLASQIGQTFFVRFCMWLSHGIWRKFSLATPL